MPAELADRSAGMTAELTDRSAVMSDDESTRPDVTMYVSESDSEWLVYEAEERRVTDAREDAQARQRLAMTCRGLVHREIHTPAILEDMFGGSIMRFMGLARYVLRR